MIDLGLAASMAVTAAAVALVARRSDHRSHVDPAVGAFLVATLVARVVRLAVEHPEGLLRPLEVVSVRSGVEWWAGVAAGVAWWWWRSPLTPVAARVAALAATAPLLLVGAGVFSATCVVRDGCPGPASPVGLVPPGLSSRVFPTGVAIGLVLVGVGLALLFRPGPPVRVLAVAIGAVAVTRTLGTVLVPSLSGWGPRELLDPVIGVGAVVVAVTGAVRMGDDADG